MIGNKTAIRLLMFAVFFLEEVGRPPNTTFRDIAARYDRSLGKPPLSEEELQREVLAIKAVKTWPDFFARIHVPFPGMEPLNNWLRKSITRR